MTNPNGLNAPPQQQESVDYADVLEYWRNQVLDLHSRLAVAAAQVRNRDKEISALRDRLSALETNGG